MLVRPEASRSVVFNDGVGISKEGERSPAVTAATGFGVGLALHARIGAIARLCHDRRNQMRPLSILGIVLIVLGLVAMFAGGFSYTKDKETADLGPVDITVKDKEHVRVPMPVSAGVIVLGVVLLIAGRRPSTA
jgi:uncharacterized membrane protein